MCKKFPFTLTLSRSLGIVELSEMSRYDSAYFQPFHRSLLGSTSLLGSLCFIHGQASEASFPYIQAIMWYCCKRITSQCRCLSRVFDQPLLFLQRVQMNYEQIRDGSVSGRSKAVYDEDQTSPGDEAPPLYLTRVYASVSSSLSMAFPYAYNHRRRRRQD